MEKAADAFRTISEVALELDVHKHVLRFWEGKFPQVKPMKRGGGRRYYRPDDVVLLKGIRRLLYDEGYTIKGVQKVIRDHGLDFVKTTGGEASDDTAKSAPPNQVGEAIASLPEPESQLAGAATRTTARGKPGQVTDPAPPAKASSRRRIIDAEEVTAPVTQGRSVPAKRGQRPSPATPLAPSAVPASLSQQQIRRLQQARRELEICLHLLGSDTDEDESEFGPSPR
jgi:DNA-binding transcriptional MerR regulator